MRPPFDLSPKMLMLCMEVGRVLGHMEGLHVTKPEPKLRRTQRVRTIQGSLAIEGNTLSLDQVTALLEGKRVVGPEREVLEVKNALKVYKKISSFQPYSSRSLLEAHGILMKGLTKEAGRWRSKNVGIFQGERIAHAAPQAKMVAGLMKELFHFVKTSQEIHPLILSSVFHYELEFTHPFSDGNGRMGRLWQTVLLSKYHPLFEFTPVESAIKDRQEEYYKVLGQADKEGRSTSFIEFSLEAILEALKTMANAMRPGPLSPRDRLEIAYEKMGSTSFSRKDYLHLFKTISTATASRDLLFGVQQKILSKAGSKALTVYRFKT